jgi:hypothetical protein
VGCAGLVVAPFDAVQPSDGLGSELREEGTGEVEVVRSARVTLVRDRGLDRLAAVCSTVLSVAVCILVRRADVHVTLIVLPQIGFRFGFGVAPGKLL